METEKRGILNRIPPELKEKLISLGNTLVFKRGDILYKEKTEMPELIFLLKGYAALSRSSRYGEERILFLCAEGDLTDELVLQDGRARNTAVCLSDCEVLKVPAERFEELLGQHPQLMRALFDSLAVKTRSLYHQTGNSNGTYPPGKRLAARILKLSRDFGTDTEQGREIGFKVTVTMLASMTGAKRETVSRYLSALKKEGCLTHEDGILTVTDTEALKAKI